VVIINLIQKYLEKITYFYTKKGNRNRLFKPTTTYNLLKTSNLYFLMLSKKQDTSSFLGIELLKSFSKKELQKFELFIKSPYFNTDDKLIQLFEILQKKVLKTEFNDQLQAEVYQFAFQKIKNSVLDKIEKKTLIAKLSKLNQLIHHFLVIEKLDYNKNCFNDLLYKSLLEKRQYNVFLILSKRDKKQLETKKRKDTFDFEHLYKIETHYLEYLFLSGKLYSYKENNIISVLYNLDVFYLQNKLSHYLESLVYEQNSSLKYSLSKNLFDAIENLLELPVFDNEISLKVLKDSIAFIERSNLSTYNNYFSLLQEKHDEIPIDSLRGYYQLLLNFLVKETKKGNTIFEKELVKIYFSMDNKNLLLEEGLIAPTKLKNLIVRLCKSKNFEEAIYFTEKYSPNVRLADRKSIFNHCLATISFYQKDYEKALEHLLQVEGTNVTLETNHRLLMMKLLYERDKHYSERTERYLRSAEKFFVDNKLLSSQNKKSYKNFTHIIINLYRLKHNEGRMSVDKLSQKLEGQDYNIDKKWLLEKMEELQLKFRN